MGGFKLGKGGDRCCRRERQKPPRQGTFWPMPGPRVTLPHKLSRSRAARLAVAGLGLVAGAQVPVWLAPQASSCWSSGRGGTSPGAVRVRGSATLRRRAPDGSPFDPEYLLEPDDVDRWLSIATVRLHGAAGELHERRRDGACSHALLHVRDHNQRRPTDPSDPPAKRNDDRAIQARSSDP